jgi:hypothetical protein
MGNTGLDGLKGLGSKQLDGALLEVAPLFLSA